MNLRESEFTALRQVIAVRGSLRMALLPFTVVGWTLSVALLSGSLDRVLSTSFSLVVLWAGFEAVYAAHVGVERIGRYLQAFYEADPEGPRWETVAMTLGPAAPGATADPLFTAVFAGATLLNVLPAAISSMSPIELGLCGALHAGVLVRLVRARAIAGRQRALDLESVQAIRSAQRGST